MPLRSHSIASDLIHPSSPDEMTAALARREFLRHLFWTAGAAGAAALGLPRIACAAAT